MHIYSDSFNDNQTIPNKNTCAGAGISPDLTIEEVPPEAKSLAIAMVDPDAVSGTFVHWLVWNVDAHMTHIKEGALLANFVNGAASNGEHMYVAPCPPVGTGVHRYIFTVYALDSHLTLQTGASYDEFLETIKDKTIDQANLTGLFSQE